MRCESGVSVPCRVAMVYPETCLPELDVERLSSKLTCCVVGREIHLYEELESTMDEAKGMAEDGAPEGAVVIAEAQTSGRGRFDRTWISAPGKDLVFSVVFRPDAAQAPYINMAAALSVRTVVADVTGLNASIKWPNDVKLAGRKVAGILIEGMVSRESIEYTVLGVGLNVNSNPASSPEIAETATSIYRETGTMFDRTDFLMQALHDLDRRYALIKDGQSMKQEWATQLETLGQRVVVRWRDRVEEGTATGVDEMGNLVIAREDGTTKTVVAGEVTLQG